MKSEEKQMEDVSVGRINALVELARSAREDNVDVVLRTVVETIQSTAGFDIVVFNTYRPAWDDYEVALVLGPTDGDALMHTRKSRHEFESTLLTPEYEIQRGTYFVPASAQVWRHVADFMIPIPSKPPIPDGWDPEDALLVQLKDSRGEPLGVLSIDQPRSGHHPDSNQLHLLRAICSHAEQSLENAHASAERERHRKRLAHLLSASARFHQCSTHREVLETACEVLVPGLGFEKAAIYFEEGHQFLPLAISTFNDASVAPELNKSVLNGFQDHSNEVGGSWIVPAETVHGSEEGSSRSQRNGAGKFGWNDEVLLAPMFDVEGKPRIVFAIEDPVTHLRPTEIERDLIRLLVEQTDAALERVSFRKRLEQLVDHDATTGLLNRRALARITSEVEAMVMICDLDHFKTLNDTYGHDAGDAVIGRFADHLRAFSRDDDLAVRLGGDEFMLYLPLVTESQANDLARRLCVEVPPLMSPIVPSPVTVSIGLSHFAKGENLIDVMRRADQALYEAKKSGRNQIVSM